MPHNFVKTFYPGLNYSSYEGTLRKLGRALWEKKKRPILIANPQFPLFLYRVLHEYSQLHLIDVDFKIAPFFGGFVRTSYELAYAPAVLFEWQNEDGESPKFVVTFYDDRLTDASYDSPIHIFRNSEAWSWEHGNFLRRIENAIATVANPKHGFPGIDVEASSPPPSSLWKSVKEYYGSAIVTPDFSFETVGDKRIYYVKRDSDVIMISERPSAEPFANEKQTERLPSETRKRKGLFRFRKRKQWEPFPRGYGKTRGFFEDLKKSWEFTTKRRTKR